jgi:hypothetical protein
MLEFIFGWILGVWMGQQFPLPSVQTHVQRWWNQPAQPVQDTSNKPEEESTVPVFTGEMPSSA